VIGAILARKCVGVEVRDREREVVRRKGFPEKKVLYLKSLYFYP
jgi:hypothetical protein